MSGSIRDLALGYYDNKESVKACQEFFEDQKNPEKQERAFYSVLPILGIIIRKEFRNVDEFSADDLIQVGAIEYWKLLDNKNKKPRPFDARAHLNLYYKVGVRAMLKAREQMEPEIANFLYANAQPFAGSYNFRSPEQRIFVKEIPAMIYDAVIGKLYAAERFSEAEIDACEYIARSIIFETVIVPHQIRQLGGKSINIEFFEGYVDALVRQAFVELRQNTDIGDMLGDEGAASDPRYYSTFDSDNSCAKRN